jgi:hypothetical protein
MLKADLHVHTQYSFDSTTKLEKIIDRCLKIGINCLAITDHGTAAGALKMKQIAPFTIIVGEEILTPHGEVMGYFLTESVPSPTSVREAIARIKAQGGLVALPHPFGRFRSAALTHNFPEELIPQLDIIEVFNARAAFISEAEKAEQFANEHHLLKSAGSDAHLAWELGRAYVEMPEFNSASEFCHSLSQGKIFGQKTTPLVHLLTPWVKLGKRFHW